MTTAEIAELVAAQPGPHAVRDIHRVSAFADAAENTLVFAQDDVAVSTALASAAGLILAPLTATSNDSRILRVRNPKYAFALCGRALAPQPADPLIHPSAIIDPSATIGAGTRIGAGAVIEANVIVGADCALASRVTLCQGAQLGDRVIVQSGAVIGSTGFGYVRNPDTGEHLLFPQQGACIIEDDVEIGANTTIDRGALGETRIGCGTKIDNQVHIGHNCLIGRNVIIAAQVGISGSCVIEDGAVLAGQAGLGDHVTIGKGVIMGGASGVFPHKHVEGPGQMFMGVPAEPLKDYLKTLAKIRRLK
jgi:UDP-3-O-[3-hydroxymyristoyl] glucosamine N-acyltransferase